MTTRRSMAALFAVVLGAFALVFVVANRALAHRLIEDAGSIDVTFVLLGLLCSGLAMANRGMLNRAAHRAVGLDAGVAAMTHTAAVGFAAQKMIKSAGAVGLAVFVRHGRRRGFAAAEVAAACILTAVASFVALGVLLVVAIGVLAATGGLGGWWIAAAVGFAIYATLVAVLATVIARSRRIAERLWQAGQRLRRRLPGDRPTSGAAFPAELFDAVAAARRQPDAMRSMMLHAVASKALGALMLAAAVTAAGLPISTSGAVVVYATALAASMVTIVPGGFGAVEGSTAALLLAAGASAGAAALAVALFRLFDLWVPVLTGALAARGELRPPDAPAAPRPRGAPLAVAAT